MTSVPEHWVAEHGRAPRWPPSLTTQVGLKKQKHRVIGNKGFARETGTQVAVGTASIIYGRKDAAFLPNAGA